MRALPSFLVGLAWLGLAHLVGPPVYEFAPAEPFRGKAWRDPYAELAVRDAVALRVNLHTHTKTGAVFAPGAAPIERVRAAYDALDYDAVAISNYMAITPPEEGVEGLYLSAYEHGYGVPRRWHFSAVGATRVDWLDYPLFQTLDAKQHRIDRLRADAALVLLNHPDLDDAFAPDELRRLSGYQAIELHSRFADAEAHWDAALSAGRLVFGVCTDDTRKYTRPRHAGIGYVVIHARERSAEAALEALRAGRFAAIYRKNLAEPNALAAHRIADGRLHVRLAEPADVVRVIGHDGLVRWRGKATDRVAYALRDDDTYLRVHATTRDTQLFTQPVVRHEPGADPRERAEARVRPGATALRRALGAAVALALAWVLLIQPALRSRNSA